MFLPIWKQHCIIDYNTIQYSIVYYNAIYYNAIYYTNSIFSIIPL